MAKTILVEDNAGQTRFLVRGPWTAAQLRGQFYRYLGTKGASMTFRQWLAYSGKVYTKLGSK